MQRKSYVWPHPETGAVELEDLAEELAGWAVVLLRMGGVLSVVQQREPTDAPGEMRSVVVVVEWKDRTDAREQLEQQVQLVAPVAPPEPGEAEPEGETGAEEAEEAAAIHADLAPAQQRAMASIGDGLDESALEEEDFDSVPEHAR